MLNIDVISGTDPKNQVLYCYNFSNGEFYKHTVVNRENSHTFTSIYCTDEQYQEAIGIGKLMGLTDISRDLLDLDSYISMPDEEYIIGGSDPGFATQLYNLIPLVIQCIQSFTDKQKKSGQLRQRQKIAQSVLPYIVAAGEDPDTAVSRSFEYADAFMNKSNVTDGTEQ